MARGAVGVENALLTHLAKGGRYLLAVSGGKDSMCLLKACIALRRQLQLELEVAHVNYHYRPESNEDMDFVVSECTKDGIELHILECEPPDRGVNFESWARDQRYRFFSSCLEKSGLDLTLTAHTAHDRAETLLMRLVSNKEPTSIHFKDLRRRLLRPFLDVPLRNIEEYIRENKIPFVEDSTNGDTQFLRNRVRHTLIPMLEKQFEPKITDILSERAEALHEDIHVLNILSRRMLATLDELPWGTPAWTKKFKSILHDEDEIALHWRMVGALLAEKTGFSPGRGHCLRALDVLLGNSLACELPEGWKMRRNKGGEISLVHDTL